MQKKKDYVATFNAHVLSLGKFNAMIIQVYR